MKQYIVEFPQQIVEAITFNRLNYFPTISGDKETVVNHIGKFLDSVIKDKFNFIELKNFFNHLALALE